MPIFRKQAARIHAKGGPRPRISPAAAQDAAARIAHFGQLAGAAGAARAQIASVLASAGVQTVQNGKGIVDTEGSIIGQLHTAHNGVVDSSGTAGPRGYSGGAYGGFHAPAGGGGDPTAGLMALLTGGGSSGSGDFGVRPIDLVTLEPGPGVEHPEPPELPKPPAEKPPPPPTGDFPPPRTGGPSSYDPDAAGGGYNPFYHRAYVPPKTGGDSTGDSEFGGSAATQPTRGRSGPRLGVGLNDAPVRATPAGPSAQVAHLPRFWTPGGYSGR